MTCDKIAELQALHDDELAPEARVALVLHVEGCAACQDELVALDALSDLVREAAPAPPPDVWRTFDADLRAGLATTPQGLVLLPGGARRLGPALAVAATVAAVALPLWLFAFEPRIAFASEGPMPQIGMRYSEPDVPPSRGAGAPRGLEAAMAALGPAAGKQLERDLVVQVRVAAADLEALGEWAPSGTTPLWTADASLLLVGAAASRAAWALERDVVAPDLLRLLDGALRELAAFEGRSREPAVVRAARRAREVLAVACALAGGQPALLGESRGRVEAEVAAVRAARGARVSPILGREVDDRAFVPRGLWATDPVLARHARAVAWLTRAGLRLDGASPDEARAAALLTLALAAAPGTNGRSGLGELARLEGALEVLVGPPDGLVAGDLLEALRQVLGRASVRPSDLAPDDLVLDLAERARAEAAARGRERVGPPGPPELHLVGGTRSLAGEALQQLVDPAVPGRGREASSLDLLALLGSRQARTIISARRADPPGFDPAFEKLRLATSSWRETQGELPARTCLEQGRLWAAAALLDPTATSAGPAGRAYRDRLLLASLAALEAVPPSGSGRPAPRLLAPLVVEPLPRLHARLAFGARRLATALEQVAEGRVAPRVAAALVDLRRVAELEEGLREASVDALIGSGAGGAAIGSGAGGAAIGRGQGKAGRDALRDAPALLAALAPLDLRTASDLLELRATGEAQVLHRVVFGLDRLAVVVPDGQGGLVAAIGPAFAAGEVWTRGQRLAPADVASTRREDPEWATHLAR